MIAWFIREDIYTLKPSRESLQENHMTIVFKRILSSLISLIVSVQIQNTDMVRKIASFLNFTTQRHWTAAVIAVCRICRHFCNLACVLYSCVGYKTKYSLHTIAEVDIFYPLEWSSGSYGTNIFFWPDFISSPSLNHRRVGEGMPTTFK